MHFGYQIPQIQAVLSKLQQLSWTIYIANIVIVVKNNNDNGMGLERNTHKISAASQLLPHMITKATDQSS